MTRNFENNPTIMVVEDVHETREGIEKLLTADGYFVTLARHETDAIEQAHLSRPNLILVSLAGSPHEVIASARQIRDRALLGDDVPIVIFCVVELSEGDEVGLGHNLHITRPDNFNQLRSLLRRLLNRIPEAAEVTR